MEQDFPRYQVMAPYLGRLRQPDRRDLRYLMRDHFALEGVQVRPFRYWALGALPEDQDSVPYCVGASLHGELVASPNRWRPDRIPTFEEIYHGAQDHDPWPGHDYDGSTVRGGAEYLKSIGYFTNYLWCFNTWDMVRWLSEFGPVVCGTDWTEEMSLPNLNGVIYDGGELTGGHAWKVHGYNLAARMFRMENSWSYHWGQRGKAWVPFDVMDRLIENYGEVCAPTDREITPIAV